MKPKLKSSLSEVAEFFIHFIMFYASFLYIWLNYEGYYNYFMLQNAMSIFMWQFDFELVKITTIDTHSLNFFFTNDYFEKMRVNLAPFKLSTTVITYNIPMTLSATVALIIVKSRRKLDYLLIVYVFIMLMLLHLFTLYISSVGSFVKASFTQSILSDYISRYSMVLDDYKYIGRFLIHYAIRFEPFMMMVFVWYFLQRTIDSSKY